MTASGVDYNRFVGLDPQNDDRLHDTGRAATVDHLPSSGKPLLSRILLDDAAKRADSACGRGGAQAEHYEPAALLAVLDEPPSGSVGRDAVLLLARIRQLTAEVEVLAADVEVSKQQVMLTSAEVVLQSKALRARAFGAVAACDGPAEVRVPCGDMGRQPALAAPSPSEMAGRLQVLDEAAVLHAAAVRASRHRLQDLVRQTNLLNEQLQAKCAELRQAQTRLALHYNRFHIEVAAKVEAADQQRDAQAAQRLLDGSTANSTRKRSTATSRRSTSPSMASPTLLGVAAFPTSSSTVTIDDISAFASPAAEYQFPLRNNCRGIRFITPRGSLADSSALDAHFLGRKQSNAPTTATTASGISRRGGGGREASPAHMTHRPSSFIPANMSTYNVTQLMIRKVAALRRAKDEHLRAQTSASSFAGGGRDPSTQSPLQSPNSAHAMAAAATGTTSAANAVLRSLEAQVQSQQRDVAIMFASPECQHILRLVIGVQTCIRRCNATRHAQRVRRFRARVDRGRVELAFAVWMKARQASLHHRHRLLRKLWAVLVVNSNEAHHRRAKALRLLHAARSRGTVRRVFLMWSRYAKYMTAPVDEITHMRIITFSDDDDDDNMENNINNNQERDTPNGHSTPTAHALTTAAMNATVEFTAAAEDDSGLVKDLAASMVTQGRGLAGEPVARCNNVFRLQAWKTFMSEETRRIKLMRSGVLCGTDPLLNQAYYLNRWRKYIDRRRQKRYKLRRAERHDVERQISKHFYAWLNFAAFSAQHIATAKAKKLLYFTIWKRYVYRNKRDDERLAALEAARALRALQKWRRKAVQFRQRMATANLALVLHRSDLLYPMLCMLTAGDPSHELRPLASVKSRAFDSIRGGGDRDIGCGSTLITATNPTFAAALHTSDVGPLKTVVLAGDHGEASVPDEPTIDSAQRYAARLSERVFVHAWLVWKGYVQRRVLFKNLVANRWRRRVTAVKTGCFAAWRFYVSMRRMEKRGRSAADAVPHTTDQQKIASIFALDPPGGILQEVTLLRLKHHRSMLTRRLLALRGALEKLGTPKMTEEELHAITSPPAGSSPAPSLSPSMSPSAMSLLMKPHRGGEGPGGRGGPQRQDAAQQLGFNPLHLFVKEVGSLPAASDLLRERADAKAAFRHWERMMGISSGAGQQSSQPSRGRAPPHVAFSDHKMMCGLLQALVLDARRRRQFEEAQQVRLRHEKGGSLSHPARNRPFGRHSSIDRSISVAAATPAPQPLEADSPPTPNSAGFHLSVVPPDRGGSVVSRQPTNSTVNVAVSSKHNEPLGASGEAADEADARGRFNLFGALCIGYPLYLPAYNELSVAKTEAFITEDAKTNFVLATKQRRRNGRIARKFETRVRAQRFADVCPFFVCAPPSADVGFSPFGRLMEEYNAAMSARGLSISSSAPAGARRQYRIPLPPLAPQRRLPFLLRQHLFDIVRSMRCQWAIHNKRIGRLKGQLARTWMALAALPAPAAVAAAAQAGVDGGWLFHAPLLSGASRPAAPSYSIGITAASPSSAALRHRDSTLSDATVGGLSAASHTVSFGPARAAAMLAMHGASRLGGGQDAQTRSEILTLLRTAEDGVYSEKTHYAHIIRRRVHEVVYAVMARLWEAHGGTGTPPAAQHMLTPDEHHHQHDFPTVRQRPQRRQQLTRHGGAITEASAEQTQAQDAAHNRLTTVTVMRLAELYPSLALAAAMSASQGGIVMGGGGGRHRASSRIGQQGGQSSKSKGAIFYAAFPPDSWDALDLIGFNPYYLRRGAASGRSDRLQHVKNLFKLQRVLEAVLELPRIRERVPTVVLVPEAASRKSIAPSSIAPNTLHGGSISESDAGIESIFGDGSEVYDHEASIESGGGRLNSARVTSAGSRPATAKALTSKLKATLMVSSLAATVKRKKSAAAKREAAAVMVPVIKPRKRCWSARSLPELAAQHERYTRRQGTVDAAALWHTPYDRPLSALLGISALNSCALFIQGPSSRTGSPAAVRPPRPSNAEVKSQLEVRRKSRASVMKRASSLRGSEVFPYLQRLEQATVHEGVLEDLHIHPASVEQYIAEVALTTALAPPVLATDVYLRRAAFRRGFARELHEACEAVASAVNCHVKRAREYLDEQEEEEARRLEIKEAADAAAANLSPRQRQRASLSERRRLVSDMMAGRGRRSPQAQALPGGTKTGPKFLSLSPASSRSLDSPAGGVLLPDTDVRRRITGDPAAAHEALTSFINLHSALRETYRCARVHSAPAVIKRHVGARLKREVAAADDQSRMAAVGGLLRRTEKSKEEAAEAAAEAERQRVAQERQHSPLRLDAKIEHSSGESDDDRHPHINPNFTFGTPSADGTRSPTHGGQGPHPLHLDDGLLSDGSIGSVPFVSPRFSNDDDRHGDGVRTLEQRIEDAKLRIEGSEFRRLLAGDDVDEQGRRRSDSSAPVAGGGAGHPSQPAEVVPDSPSMKDLKKRADKLLRERKATERELASLRAQREALEQSDQERQQRRLSEQQQRMSASTELMQQQLRNLLTRPASGGSQEQEPVAHKGGSTTSNTGKDTEGAEISNAASNNLNEASVLGAAQRPPSGRSTASKGDATAEAMDAPSGVQDDGTGDKTTAADDRDDVEGTLTTGGGQRSMRRVVTFAFGGDGSAGHEGSADGSGQEGLIVGSGDGKQALGAGGDALGTGLDGSGGAFAPPSDAATHEAAEEEDDDDDGRSVERTVQEEAAKTVDDDEEMSASGSDGGPMELHGADDGEYDAIVHPLGYRGARMQGAGGRGDKYRGRGGRGGARGGRSQDGSATSGVSPTHFYAQRAKLFRGVVAVEAPAGIGTLDLSLDPFAPPPRLWADLDADRTTARATERLLEISARHGAVLGRDSQLHLALLRQELIALDAEISGAAPPAPTGHASRQSKDDQGSVEQPSVGHSNTSGTVQPLHFSLEDLDRARREEALRQQSRPTPSAFKCIAPTSTARTSHSPSQHRPLLTAAARAKRLAVAEQIYALLPAYLRAEVDEQLLADKAAKQLKKTTADSANTESVFASTLGVGNRGVAGTSSPHRTGQPLGGPPVAGGAGSASHSLYADSILRDGPAMDTALRLWRREDGLEDFEGTHRREQRHGVADEPVIVADMRSKAERDAAAETRRMLAATASLLSRVPPAGSFGDEPRLPAVSPVPRSSAPTSPSSQSLGGFSQAMDVSMMAASTAETPLGHSRGGSVFEGDAGGLRLDDFRARHRDLGAGPDVSTYSAEIFRQPPSAFARVPTRYATAAAHRQSSARPALEESAALRFRRGPSANTPTPHSRSQSALNRSAPIGSTAIDGSVGGGRIGARIREHRRSSAHQSAASPERRPLSSQPQMDLPSLEEIVVSSFPLAEYRDELTADELAALVESERLFQRWRAATRDLLRARSTFAQGIDAADLQVKTLRRKRAQLDQHRDSKIACRLSAVLGRQQDEAAALLSTPNPAPDDLFAFFRTRTGGHGDHGPSKINIEK